MDCKECGEKDLETERQRDCSCHISPPCSACTDAPYICRNCGEIYEIEHSTVKSNYKPMPLPKRKTLKDLDRTKISWLHTGNGGKTFHDIHGYAPAGTTQKDLLDHMGLTNRPCLPRFKSFKSGGYFHLSYFID